MLVILYCQAGSKEILIRDLHCTFKVLHAEENSVLISGNNVLNYFQVITWENIAYTTSFRQLCSIFI